MHRFHAKLIHEQVILIRGFEFERSLDNDSEILRSINYDVFKYTRNNNRHYGYGE